MVLGARLLCAAILIGALSLTGHRAGAQPSGAPPQTASAAAGGAVPSALSTLHIDPKVAVAAPSGYIDFCHRRPDICTMGGAQTVTLTPDKWDLLVGVNGYYNDAIAPRTDLDALGVVEHWDIPVGARRVGDCEDYALSKKAHLIALGWPRSALLLAVANIPGVEPAARRHAVLIVVTDQGNFVLDNRRLKVMSWEETGYDWVSIQSPGDPYRWLAVAHDATPTVSTANGSPDIAR